MAADHQSISFAKGGGIVGRIVNCQGILLSSDSSVLVETMCNCARQKEVKNLALTTFRIDFSHKSISRNSYARGADLAEMVQERGVDVDPSTLFRWLRRYAPELETRVRWYRGYLLASGETYIKIGGGIPVPSCGQAWLADRLHACGLPERLVIFKTSVDFRYYHPLLPREYPSRYWMVEVVE